MAFESYGEKVAAISRMERVEGQCDVAHRMMETLSPAETLRMEMNPYFLERLYEIAMMVDEELEQALEEDGSAEIIPYEGQSKSSFIDEVPYIYLEGLFEDMPEWIRSTNITYGLSPLSMREYRDDCRGLLLRRLRMAMWMGIIRDRREHKKKERREVEFAKKYCGLYL